MSGTTARPASAGDSAHGERIEYGTGREILVDATIRVVARDGLAKLTHRAAATEAGTSISSITYHFGSLEGLIAAAFEHSVEVLSVSEHVAGTASDVLSSLEEHLARYPLISAFQYELILESRRRPELAPMVEAVYAPYRANLAGSLAQLGIDADDALIELILAAADGIVFQYVASGGTAIKRVRAQVGALQELIRMRQHA